MHIKVIVIIINYNPIKGYFNRAVTYITELTSIMVKIHYNCIQENNLKLMVLNNFSKIKLKDIWAIIEHIIPSYYQLENSLHLSILQCQI